MGVSDIHITSIYSSPGLQVLAVSKSGNHLCKYSLAFLSRPVLDTGQALVLGAVWNTAGQLQSVRMLIQGEGELESTPLSPAWVGAWGMLACADFRAWYGFHLLSRNLQSLVWNVSAHLQAAFEEEGESCPPACISSCPSGALEQGPKHHPQGHESHLSASLPLGSPSNTSSCLCF